MRWILFVSSILLPIGWTHDTGAPAQSGTSNRPRPHPAGFTEGYGNVKVLSFLYPQQFFCTDEVFDDLDGNGHEGDGLISARDPDEFQFPAVGPPGSPCIVGATRGGNPVGGSLPTIDPTGRPIANVEPVWAILPFFDSSRDADVILEVVDPTRDGADVQCPEPGPPFTQHMGTFGTCTMHMSFLHAEPVVKSLLEGLDLPVTVGGVPVGSPAGDIPLLNHSHIIDGDTFNPIWWQTIAVRVNDETIWPDFNGRCPANPAGGEPCLVSLRALRDAQQRGQATADTPTNAFLFFDSRQITPQPLH
jgi:hypothetical protein